MNPEVQTAAATPPTREELELTARDLVTRFLGNPSGQAHDMCCELTDDELAAIAATAGDSLSGRARIKDVFTAAYERKRKAHEDGAVTDKDRLRKRSKAARVLAARGVPAERAQEALGMLSAGEQGILAELDGETDIAEVIDAILGRAYDRKCREQADQQAIADNVSTIGIDVQRQGTSIDSEPAEKTETPPSVKEDDVVEDSIEQLEQGTGPVVIDVDAGDELQMIESREPPAAEAPAADPPPTPAPPKAVAKPVAKPKK